MTNLLRARCCVICGATTLWCCTDCAIDNAFAGTQGFPTYVCSDAECRRKHEQLCHPGAHPPMIDERKFYCSQFAAHVWVLSAQAEKQRNGEWAIYCVLIEQAGRSPMGSSDTNHLAAGTNVFSRTDWLQPPKH